MPEILVCFKQMLLVCSLAGFLRMPVAGAEESIATILQWKFQGFKNMMDHDWLTELVNMKKRDEGLQFGILEARFMAARLRGHPDSVLIGSTGDGLRNALISEASADALGEPAFKVPP